ncbi:MAG: TIGR03435 family protein [Terracidiphilus sp.]|jgi:uncharacterized protein (TIGR03435 family)
MKSHRKAGALWIALAICAIAVCSFLRSQTAAQPEVAAGPAPAYEIVSIKPDKSGSPGAHMQRLPDGFRWTNFPVSTWVRSAYDVTMDSQIVGLPGWADSEPYDIEAKADAETAEAWKKLSDKERWKLERPMMQSLLADRCQLKVHRETREMPVYDLVIAKGGLKMKEAPVDDHNGGESMGPGKMTAQGLSTDSLVSAFSGMVGRMIVDKTGLGEKKFDFELRWTPDDRRAADNAADAGPSIFTALEEQLGLKLVPAKGPVEVIVIDHIEKPSAN